MKKKNSEKLFINSTMWDEGGARATGAEQKDLKEANKYVGLGARNLSRAVQDNYEKTLNAQRTRD